jgi:hypothetical protein
MLTQGEALLGLRQYQVTLVLVYCCDCCERRGEGEKSLIVGTAVLERKGEGEKGTMG